MRLLCIAGTLCFYAAVALSQQTGTTMPESNPFFTDYSTPFKTPPFNLIKNEHYLPAFKKGMDDQKKEIDVIINNSQEPTFLNTIDALDKTGRQLEKVSNVFFSMLEAMSSDELQKIAEEVTPLLSSHNDDITLNEKLFQRIKAVYTQKSKLELKPEEMRLLENTYKDFVRSGANLSPKEKKRFRKINEELSMLTLKYGNNVLKETNTFKLVIDNNKDLDGLSQGEIDQASETAKQMKLDGKWVFTTRKPSMLPFLTYANNRTLREKLYKAYYIRGDNNNDADNKKNLAKIIALRTERSKMLGYKTYADFGLEKSMAKNPRAVYELLQQIWVPALNVAKQERKDMQVIIDKEGGKFKLASWDWWYYSEKVRKDKFNLDENEVRAYLQVENVRKSVFDVASKLFGIQFIERNDIPKYMDEVTVFEVKRSDGSHLGILYTDYFPRASKRAGAWCGEFRRQERFGEAYMTPVVYNVGNLAKPSGDQPALLSMDDVETLYHEFGHALHSLFQNISYSSLPVPRDFVELPSQLMEHWAFEPEVLRSYARHYKTGEVIPQTLIDKITKSQKFNQGFKTVEYLAASFLDMDYHTTTSTKPIADINGFEKKSMKKIGLMPEILPRYRSTYFTHVTGGYAAGYYSYIWAEVLDADGFEAFKEKGLFDQTTAKAYLDNVLSKGGTEDAMDMYVKFRGKKPTITPLLKNRGLIE
jgi:peptidyl-dipeptidase Dcp